MNPPFESIFPRKPPVSFVIFIGAEPELAEIKYSTRTYCTAHQIRSEHLATPGGKKKFESLGQFQADTDGTHLVSHNRLDPGSKCVSFTSLGF